jgi:hypothetical protein
VFAFIVTMHVIAETPVHAPPQPVNATPAGADAVSATVVPCAYVWEQSVPHVTPIGVLMMAPPVAPARVTVSV